MMLQTLRKVYFGFLEDPFEDGDLQNVVDQACTIVECCDLSSIST